MIDVVRILEKHCEEKCYLFFYGSAAHINLIESGDKLEPEQVYFLLFPVKRKGMANDTKTGFKGHLFNGKFMLVKGSDFANHYFNENEKDQKSSKYTNNIEPLLDCHEAFGAGLMCDGIDLADWSCEDAVDVLDSNKDGLWCTFSMIDLK